MSISPAKVIPHKMKKTMIKIFSYENKCMQGTIFNPFFEKELVFENVMQMIIMIERISNSLLYPQRAMKLRKFHNAQNNQDNISFDFITTADFSEKFPIATFELEILFRQNASWQGNLVFAENHSTSAFRSVLELLALLDNALAIEK